MWNSFLAFFLAEEGSLNRQVRTLLILRMVLGLTQARNWLEMQTPKPFFFSTKVPGGSDECQSLKIN